MSILKKNGSFSKASFWKKFAIVIAGPIVNIIFGLGCYFILVAILYDLQTAAVNTWGFMGALIDSVKVIFTGGANIDDLAGPVGIATIVAKTAGVIDFVYILSVISLSLGITNLLPIPPLDGGKLIIYIVEWIKRKPIKEETSLKIQMAGFLFIIGLSIFVMYNDIARIM